MGPTILFDKSAIQGLGISAVDEVGRYFSMVIPPVLLMETLADLSLKRDDVEAAKQEVMVISSKLFPRSSSESVDYRTLCIGNLLGTSVPMNRRPLVSGGVPVTASDGSRGVFFGVSPGADAVSRWRVGDFNETDLQGAIAWREQAQGANLEQMKSLVPWLGARLRSLTQVVDVVDRMLASPPGQGFLLNLLSGLFRFTPRLIAEIQKRWNKEGTDSLQSFAPYAQHCLRVQLLFNIAMLNDLVGTRPSNIVDIEYLYYTPFSSIFCSGDKLHNQLAPLVMFDDQSYLKKDDLRLALTAISKSRETGSVSPLPDDSLIRQLWVKHCKVMPPAEQPLADDQRKRVMDSVRPILEAIQGMEDPGGPRFPA